MSLVAKNKKEKTIEVEESTLNQILSELKELKEVANKPRGRKRRAKTGNVNRTTKTYQNFDILSRNKRNARMVIIDKDSQETGFIIEIPNKKFQEFVTSVKDADIGQKVRIREYHLTGDMGIYTPDNGWEIMEQ